MSIEHIGRVLRLGPEVDGATRLVAISLAEHAGRDTDECWPSVATIRAEAGLKTDRAVQKAIRKLSDLGLIEYEVNAAPDGRIPRDRRPNLYRLVGELALGTGARQTTPRVEDGGASRAATGARPTTERGRAARPDGGAPDDPLTVREPTGEPTGEPEPALRAGATRRGTRCPDPFLVTGPMREWAAEEAPLVDVKATTAAFVDYWRALPGQRGVKLDWQATWRNWLRKEQAQLAIRSHHRRPARDRYDETSANIRNIFRGGEPS